ncbi:hypothetical protein [Mycobacterium mantenii]|uniref:ATP/GTP-binding protein n=1 Tax=Mycobacterium mantenii TaxID=560555 RepID=A0A1A2T0G5_MYCNT|nr:hypothetical protein [Mycobacterium mantenii]OBH43908.1 hypothetical protein A5688_09940 [Mycobacterium mantenii]OBH57347.1 hypothetical protein A5687_23050 [Mycobacterium mantenii]OBH69953.1 hypothetical protein A5682_10050 [Mycobacterium mantenii]OBH70775.1 hypothetical protein A5683_03135 [Mycobacterium mantenii]
MARRRTPSRRQRPWAPLPELRRVETGPDGHDYEVRAVPAARAVKTYRCPGCDHEIRSGSAHLVVWPIDSTFGAGPGQVEDRRHWHTPCWAHRATRGPTRKWS